jgi:hypothetical protein
MSKKTASMELMEALHGTMAQQMLARLQGATEDAPITAAEWNTIRQFLKDNHIDCTPDAADPLGQLRAELPFATVEGVLGESLN